ASASSSGRHCRTARRSPPVARSHPGGTGGRPRTCPRGPGSTSCARRSRTRSATRSPTGEERRPGHGVVPSRRCPVTLLSRYVAVRARRCPGTRRPAGGVRSDAPGYLTRMTNQVMQSVDVDVPVSTAYNQWTQFESFPRFMGAVERIDQISDTRTHWVTKIAGVEREFDAEITEQHPDERIAWRTV